VLEGAPEPMHYVRIAEAVVENGLRNNVGATPQNTVARTLNVSINTEGASSPFVKVHKGVFALREARIQTSAERPPLLLSDDIEDSSLPESHSIINSFGMYWSRSMVDWSLNKNVRILGRQQVGASQVDFAGQIGVYLLHDNRGVVYVGRSVERPLGVRLYEHTQDRLRGRWDRFSWFGLKKVAEDGQLAAVQFDLSTSLIVCTLEALLIEGLEPPQNRKRGDDFNAIEFIQAEDPVLKKKYHKEALAKLLESVAE